MPKLSILIPSRQEMFLAKTIENLLENIEGDTEIIAVLDGAWADPPVSDDKRVTLVYLSESIGQRASINLACRLSKAKYVMKVDAHCSFDKGFDVKMIAEMKDNWTMVPTMKNLHGFDWVCPDGHRRYQGPSGVCKECDKKTTRDILWKEKPSPNSVSYCFDSEPHFQYFGDFPKRPEGQGEITPTMSLQGSCWMLTREKYWELGVCGEEFGSWGSQGIEVACKTWLSGGQVMVNKKTWYAHMFRTQGGDFSFPYSNSGRQVEKAKKHARNLFFGNRWEKQIHSLSWLVEKFWPVQGWNDDDLAKLKKADRKPFKQIIYYTDNQLKIKIAKKCQNNLTKIGLPIISVSLKPMPHFGQNIHFKGERGYLTMFKQILAGLEASNAKIVFFCEHDVLYSPTHFDFIPPRKDTFYYNVNVWKVRASDGHALWVDDCKQVSGLCGYRTELIKHYKERIAKVEAKGRYERNMGFEPGTSNRIEWKHKYKSDSWMSKYPNADIRHDGNLTPNRWSKAQFRNQCYTKGWMEANSVPFWGKIEL